LLVEMLAQVALQGGYRHTAKAGRNRFRVAGLDVLIENFFRVNEHQRAGSAEAHAAGAANEGVFTGRGNGFGQFVTELIRMLAEAAGTHANVDLVIELRVFGADGLGNLFEFFEGHSTAHLSSCSSICSPLIWPQSSPSVRTTGARPHAPTQRAVMRLIFPSVVVWPWGTPRRFSAAATSLSVPLM